MPNPYAWILVVWTAVLGQKYGGKEGVASPIQVATVAVGVGVLAAGTAGIVAYGLYAQYGRTRALADALGEGPPPANAQPAPAAHTPAATDPDAPAAQQPGLPALTPQSAPAPGSAPAAPGSAPAPQNTPAADPNTGPDADVPAEVPPALLPSSASSPAISPAP